MNFKKSFPSKYLQSADLDQPLLVTISKIDSTNIGQGDDVELKLVAHFREPVKSCILNLTRCHALVAITGSEDTDRWVGARIQLSRGMTSFKGKPTACIVMAAPPRSAARPLPATPAPLRATRPAPAPPLEEPPPPADYDDSVPDFSEEPYSGGSH